MATGTVKWFNDVKCYGFITLDDSGDDAFVHFKDIEMSGFKTLKEGQRVELQPEMTSKGLQARAVKPISSVPAS